MRILSYDEWTPEIISIEVISENFDIALLEKKTEYVVPEQTQFIVNQYKNKLNNYDQGFIGVTKQKQSIRMLIEPTYHYMQRLFRAVDPANKNPNVINPYPFEGMNLIYNNRDKMAGLIASGRFRNNDEVLITTVDGSQYSVIITTNSVRKNLYKIILLAQIKGDSFSDREFFRSRDRLFQFHPNGTKNKEQE